MEHSQTKAETEAVLAQGHWTVTSRVGQGAGLTWQVRKREARKIRASREGEGGGRAAFVRKEGPPAGPAVAVARVQSTWTPLQLPVGGPGPVWPAEESSGRLHTTAESTQDWAGGMARAYVSVLVQSLKCRSGNNESNK